MSKKTFIYGGMFIGSLIGGYLPVMFASQSLFSMSSLIGNTLGALIGIYLGFKLATGLGL